MLKVVMLKGLPASGKSTYAKDYILSNPSYKRVNKDDLRKMLHNKAHSKDREKFVLEIRDSIIINALSNGFSIIVDDTNLDKKHEEAILKLVEKHNAIVDLYKGSNQDFYKHKAKFEINDTFLKVPLRECIERDSKRGSEAVGIKVIKDMYNRYIKPTLPKIEKIPYNQNLPDCIMCDLDGTLALITDRSPYDGKSCASDVINEPIKDILDKFYDFGDSSGYIIITSARNDNSKNETTKWLYDNGVHYDVIYMRKDGDARPDNIVKEEMYNTYIKNKYNVRFVLDDRDKVVKLWRSLGLTCLQVAEGDF